MHATIDRSPPPIERHALCWPGDIDLEAEPLLTLKEAAKLPTLKKDGKSPHISALYRWASPNGSRGVRLETIMRGGSTCTTAAAVKRFIMRCSNPTKATPAISIDQRQSQIDAARERLAAAGI